MDGTEVLQQRRKAYLKELLGAFEDLVEPLLGNPEHPNVKAFKGLCRAKLNAIAVDANELLNIDTPQINGYALQLSERAGR